MAIGFIGLGIMGSRMAANLLDAGFDLVVHNRTKSKADPLLEEGAEWADAPREVASRVDTVFTMVSDPAAVRAVAFGQDGLLETMRPDALWIDCSTVNPSFTVRMALEASSQAIRFVDAPVGGSRVPAQQAQLVFFVGGLESDVAECRPYFEAMGKKVIHVGEVGLGTGMKMLFNALLASTMASFSEVAVLGEELGIDRELMFDALLDSPIVAPYLKGKREKMMSGDYDADFPLKWMQKDLHLAALTAFEQGTSSPVGNAAKELYAMANKAGLGRDDYSAIYKFLRTVSYDELRL